MTTPSNLFSNDRYVVHQGNYRKFHSGGVIEEVIGYVVVNVETDVVEFQIEQLPEAIMAAVQLNKMLDEEPWKQFEPVDVTPDGSPVGSEVH